MPMLQPPPSLPHATTVTNGEPAIEPHTAPHDEIVSVVQELIARASDGSVSIDTLANALKSRGFRRTPGSPRLITRLRRIREIAIDRGGRITLMDGRPAAPPASQPPPPIHDEPAPIREEPVEPDGNRALQRSSDEAEDEPTPGNELTGGPGRVPPGDVQPERRRRRSRRGGRGRRRGRSGAPAAP
jgi:nucleotide-binding universal stress UspA family protein